VSYIICMQSIAESDLPKSIGVEGDSGMLMQLFSLIKILLLHVILVYGTFRLSCTI